MIGKTLKYKVQNKKLIKKKIQSFFPGKKNKNEKESFEQNEQITFSVDEITFEKLQFSKQYVNFCLF